MSSSGNAKGKGDARQFLIPALAIVTGTVSNLRTVGRERDGNKLRATSQAGVLPSRVSKVLEAVGPSPAWPRTNHFSAPSLLPHTMSVPLGTGEPDRILLDAPLADAIAPQLHPRAPTSTRCQTRRSFRSSNPPSCSSTLYNTSRRPGIGPPSSPRRSFAVAGPRLPNASSSPSRSQSAATRLCGPPAFMLGMAKRWLACEVSGKYRVRSLKM